MDEKPKEDPMLYRSFIRQAPCAPWRLMCSAVSMDLCQDLLELEMAQLQQEGAVLSAVILLRPEIPDMGVLKG